MQKMPHLKQIYKELHNRFWNSICPALMQGQEIVLPIKLELGELSKAQLRSEKAGEWLAIMREEFRDMRNLTICENYWAGKNLEYPNALEFSSMQLFCKTIKLDYKVIAKLKEMYEASEDENIKDLLLANPQYYLQYYNEWRGVLDTLPWLKKHLEMGDTILIRSIKTSLDTKFIEKNTGLFLKIWDKVFGFEKSVKADIESRYGISLDKDFLIYSQRNNFEGEMILTLAKPDEKNILIVENRKMLKSIPANIIPDDSFVLGGVGKAITKISSLDWIKDKNIFYFGDLDEHGYNILVSLRKKLQGQSVQSINMNIHTLHEYIHLCANTKAKHLRLLTCGEDLTNDEYKAYIYLRENMLMLEQEKLY